MSRVRVGIGQDSHRFITAPVSKPCVIGGVIFEGVPGLLANSDGDVIFHALCNAISSLTGVRVLGGIADELCLKDGITDSEVYLQHAKKLLKKQNISHVAITVEAKKPVFKDKVDLIRANVARVLEISLEDVGMTATTGEGLTEFGCGVGIQCIAIITTYES